MAIFLLAVVLAFSGCVNVLNIFHQPASTPTPMPVVTVEPTPVPTAMPLDTPTPVPTVVVPVKSSDVKILSFYGDKGIVNFTFIKDIDYQKEFITVVVRNDGDSDAKNVVLGLTETDAHSGDSLLQQQFTVGDLRRGENKQYLMETEKHDLASSVYITVGITWGQNGEYSSPVTYLNVAKSIWM